jgi:hypothetical protein
MRECLANTERFAWRHSIGACLTEDPWLILRAGYQAVGLACSGRPAALAAVEPRLCGTPSGFIEVAG